MKTSAAVAVAATLLTSACGGAGSSSPEVLRGPPAAPIAVDFSIADDQAEAPDAVLLDVSDTPLEAVPSAADNSNDIDFATILNGLRVNRGLSTLNYDARLDAAAEKYAIEQASIGGLSHTGVDGSSVYDRIVAEGYNPSGWAENLAKGQQSQEEVLQAWINSPGHNRNLNAGLEDFAIGVAGSGSNLSWVLVFATER